jgi:hypothetical protein
MLHGVRGYSAHDCSFYWPGRMMRGWRTMTEQDQPDRPSLSLVEAMKLGELERAGFSRAGCDTLLCWRRRVRWTQCRPGEMPDQERLGRKDESP